MDLTQATLNFGLLAVGTIDSNLPRGKTGLSTADQSAELGETPAAIAVTGSTTPPGTKAAVVNIALSSGTQTVDLTSIAQGNLTALDMTGLKMIGYRIVAGTNTARISMAVGASNGYQFNGDSAGKISLGSGAQNQHYDPDTTNGAPAVGASAKDLDFASSDADATATLIMLFGT